MAQIGTVKVETPNGPVELPVYELGDSGSNRVEAFRVQTASDVSAADRPYLRVQTGNGVKAFDTSASGIPDSGDLHARYDFSEEDGSLPITDQTGNGYDLVSGTYSGVGASINGVQAGDFDGADDNVYTSFASESQPNHVFIVINSDAVTGNTSPFDGDTAVSQLVFVTNVSGNWAMIAGSTLEDGTANTGPIIISALFNGSNSAIRVNGTESTGDAGTTALDGVSLGARGDGSNNYDGAIGEVLVYPQDKSSVVGDIEKYLADKWGITL